MSQDLATYQGQQEIAEAIQNFNLDAVNQKAIWFDNVDDMKDADLPVGITAATRGYYTVNDGGSATYYIREKQVSDVEDGGSIIILDNENVAELIYNDTLNVKQFGAKGDGVADDTTAIQTCLNKSKYKICYIPSGTYIITSPITFSGSSFTIVGAGRRNTKIQKTTTTGIDATKTVGGTTFDYNDGFIIGANPVTTFSNITIKGIDFYSQGVINGYGILILDCTYTSVKDCLVQGCTKNIVSSGWCNTFEDLELFYNKSSICMHVLASPIATLQNVQSNIGALNINGSNACVDGCAFDNGNPSYLIEDSHVALNCCDCETYYYAIQANNSAVSVNGGRYEQHPSDGVPTPTMFLSATNSSKVILNAPYVQWADYGSGVSTTLGIGNNNSIVKGYVKSNVATPTWLNSYSGYNEVNDERVSKERTISNLKRFDVTTLPYSVDVPATYRELRIIRVSAVVQYYDEFYEIEGTALVGSSSVAYNGITVNGNSTAHPPTVNLTTGSGIVTLSIESSYIQKAYGVIEY